MLYRGPMGGGAASGKVGSVVASRNAAGQYLRSRVTPVNPASDRQGNARNSLSVAVSAWTALSAADQDSWRTYGSLLRIPNRLGDMIPLSGVAAFTRNAALRIFLNTSYGAATRFLPNTAPPDTNNAVLSPFTITFGPDTLGFVFDPTDPWDNQDDGGCMLFMSKPQNPGVRFCKGPYRFVQAVLGSETVPFPSPLNVSNIHTIWGEMALGSRYFFRAVAFDDQFRISSEQTYNLLYQG